MLKKGRKVDIVVVGNNTKGGSGDRTHRGRCSLWFLLVALCSHTAPLVPCSHAFKLHLRHCSGSAFPLRSLLRVQTQDLWHPYQSHSHHARTTTARYARKAAPEFQSLTVMELKRLVQQSHPPRGVISTLKRKQDWVDYLEAQEQGEHWESRSLARTTPPVHIPRQAEQETQEQLVHEQTPPLTKQLHSVGNRVEELQQQLEEARRQHKIQEKQQQQLEKVMQQQLEEAIQQEKLQEEKKTREEDPWYVESKARQQKSTHVLTSIYLKSLTVLKCLVDGKVPFPNMKKQDWVEHLLAEYPNIYMEGYDEIELSLLIREYLSATDEEEVSILKEELVDTHMILFDICHPDDADSYKKYNESEESLQSYRLEMQQIEQALEEGNRREKEEKEKMKDAL
eukprot:CAMPEP_0171013470 /NCGR_PEP_ID=MMETSP0736-20130129/24376_1 /TAXON_ID=186038 /ORGANISM="Fragilariopsis kerguelensis, Strain L26-C5" /LENGTH=395 /DNA_ID=CAMNT_0011447161 /DNA_START=75 /DNA_END=1262 /DNA_ORIENTATION=+